MGMVVSGEEMGMGVVGSEKNQNCCFSFNVLKDQKNATTILKQKIKNYYYFCLTGFPSSTKKKNPSIRFPLVLNRYNFNYTKK